jgi:hypothetical protein
VNKNVTNNSVHRPLSVKVDDSVGDPYFFTRVPQNPINKERNPFQGVDIIKGDGRLLLQHYHCEQHRRGQRFPSFDPGFAYWQQQHARHSFLHQMTGNQSMPFEGQLNQQMQGSHTSSILRSQDQQVMNESFDKEITGRSSRESNVSFLFPQPHHLLHPLTLWNPYPVHLLQPMSYSYDHFRGHYPPPFHPSQGYLSHASQLSSKNREVQNATSLFHQQKPASQYLLPKKTQLMPNHERDNHNDCKSLPRVFHGEARCFSDSAFVSTNCQARDLSSYYLSPPSHSLPPPLIPSSPNRQGNQRNNLSGQSKSSTTSKTSDQDDKEKRVPPNQTRTSMRERTSFSSSSLTSLSSLTSSSQEDCLTSLEMTDSSSVVSSSLSDDFKKKASVSSENSEQHDAGNEMNSFVARVSKSRRRRKRSSNPDKKLVLESDLFDPFYSLLLLHSISHHLLRSFFDDIGKHFDTVFRGY